MEKNKWIECFFKRKKLCLFFSLFVFCVRNKNINKSLKHKILREKKGYIFISYLTTFQKKKKEKKKKTLLLIKHMNKLSLIALSFSFINHVGWSKSSTQEMIRTYT
jgi:hypothetical protein